jgi:hypothetical protein
MPSYSVPSFVLRNLKQTHMTLALRSVRSGNRAIKGVKEIGLRGRKVVDFKTTKWLVCGIDMWLSV